MPNANPQVPTPVDPDTPSHQDNGDSDRTRWADTSRDGSTRVTRAQAAITMDFRSQSQGEECGSPIDVPDMFGMGTVRVSRTPDPWSTNRPIGGAPDSYVGRPRP